MEQVDLCDIFISHEVFTIDRFPHPSENNGPTPCSTLYIMKTIVSVVIATKNEARNLQMCLESIKNQSYPKSRIEIILVDNFSTDNTVEIAKQYASHVYLKKPERSAQRNYGIKKSCATYILYLDADMKLSPHVIKSSVELLERNPDLAGLFIPEHLIGNSLWVKIRRFERKFYTGTVIDAIRFFRRMDFLSIGGFDKRLSAFEDWDLTKRLQVLGSFATIHEPLFHIEQSFTLQKFIVKKLMYDRATNFYISKWGKDDRDIKKQFGLFYRLLGVFIENGKWKRTIVHPHFLLGVYILRGILFVSILCNRLFPWKKS